jgi:branched-chain amino acid transport system permease protein
MKVSVITVLLFLLITLPLFLGIYWLRLLFLLFTYIALANAYDIVGGYLGYINLGFASFFALGAYVFDILQRAGIPLPLAVIGGGVASLMFAMGISYPFFRLKGAYFAVATFGLLTLLYYTFANLVWLTGGLWGRPLPIPSVEAALPAYYASLGLVIATLLTNYKILKSKFGLALISVKEDEVTASEYGINIFRVKMKAFMISAFFAGLIGGVYVFNIGFISPRMVLALDLALAPIVMAMLGGSGTLLGPLIGATLLVIAQEIIWTKTEYFHLAMYGIIMLIIVFFAPAGIINTRFFRKLLRKLS